MKLDKNIFKKSLIKILKNIWYIIYIIKKLNSKELI